MKYVILFFLFIQISSLPQQSYQHLGGPYGGEIGDISIATNGDIFAGAFPFGQTFSDGLYKSTDKGKTWVECSTNSIYRLQVLSILNTESDEIWVGTYWSGRLFFSSDFGLTWEIRNNGLDDNTYCWALIEGNSNDIFLGAETGTYRTTNKGSNWEKITTESALYFEKDKNNNIYFGSYSGGLFKSTDNGLNWIKNLNFPNLTVPVIYIDSLTNYIFCGTGYYSNGNGVYLSTDNGINWTNIGLQGMSILGIVKDSLGNIIAGIRNRDSSLFRTSNLGQTWEKIGNGLNVEIARLKMDELGYIYAGSENDGLYKSTNGGLNFDLIGLPIAKVTDIGVSKDNNYIYTATILGMQRYDKQVKKWENKLLNNVRELSVSPSNILYAATNKDGIYRSTDSGNNWQYLNFQNTTILGFNAISDSFLVTASGFKFWISKNGGLSWDSTGIHYNDDMSKSIIYDKKNKRLFFNSEAKIYFSENEGLNFTSINLPSEFMYKNGLAVTGNGDLYYVSQLVPTKVYKISYPYTSTWQEVFPKGSSVYVDNDDNVYVGRDIGVYRSTNYGQSWELIFNKNMPFLEVLDMKKSGSSLFIATDSYGVYEVMNLVNVKEESNYNANDYSLEQNYPNPFNPSTNIKFSLPEGSITTIKVYDILGEEKATILDEYKPAGSYSASFEAKDLPSGVYIYTITSGSFKQSRKMMLMK